MALATVTEYVSFVRELLQDEVDSPYRYSDASILRALSLALPRAKMLRPDLFAGVTIPTYTVNDTTIVPMDEMYRLPLAYFCVGMMQLRDDEETQDQRAAAFLGLATAQLLSVT